MFDKNSTIIIVVCMTAITIMTVSYLDLIKTTNQLSCSLAKHYYSVKKEA